MTAEAPLLSIRDLTVDFAPGSGRLPAVDGVSFDIAPREIVCLVGESGSARASRRRRHGPSADHRPIVSRRIASRARRSCGCRAASGGMSGAAR